MSEQQTPAKPETKPTPIKPAGAAAKPAGARPAGVRPAGARGAGVRPPGQRPPGATGAGGAPGAATGKTKFIISKFSPTYLSSWQSDQDTCTICRSLFIAPCVNCEVNGETEACPIQEGCCGHMFHMHCIERWLTQDPTCPLCHEKWEVKAQ
ncbi:RING finger [Tritrichomonas foetus]|uniref:RING finger n=1 Tax=Tritrichomonas foetus TaxID=1144522 RepID=A0A1J4KHT9_9EUKA|nr:RING finger [Tritrichomonas foetus]|eukprot:OHT10959.1 RING finger [Tritrichomonas foetus]